MESTNGNKKLKIILISCGTALLLAIVGTVGGVCISKAIKSSNGNLSYSDNVVTSSFVSGDSNISYNTATESAGKVNSTVVSSNKNSSNVSSGESQEESQTSDNGVEDEQSPEKTEFLVKTDNTVEVGADIEAEAVIVINLSDNSIVACKNEEQILYPASITKVMTVLVALENIDSLNATYVMTQEIKNACAGAAVAGLSVGEKVTMQDLLYATMLPSGADAALCLANSIAGSEKNFVSLMNKKAKEIGMTQTIFSNVTGLHSEMHFSTAYDLAILMTEALKNGKCKEIMSAIQYTTSATTQHPSGITVSSSFMSGAMPYQPSNFSIYAGKTGITGKAGYCLAAVSKSKKTGDEYVSIILKCADRESAFAQQKKLYNNYVK